jgi:uridine kinase
MRLTQTLAEHISANLDKQPPPLLVAICGWADTGKSSLAKGLSAALATLGVAADWISTDAFMKDRAERNALGITGYDPSSIDSSLLVSAMDHFAAGEPFAYRDYDNRSGTKHETPRIVAPGRVLVVEGIHALHPSIQKRFLLRIFIDSDELTLREMRRQANVLKRGMNAVDAMSRIQSEWEDFCSIVLTQKPLANLVVHVNREYEYSCPLLRDWPAFWS